MQEASGGTYGKTGPRPARGAGTGFKGVSPFEAGEAVETRPPKILDVVRAVTAVATTHPEVTVWWYSPPVRFHLRGAEGGCGRESPLEIFLELKPETTADFEAISAELSERLWGRPVAVRVQEGHVKGKQLFRILSAKNHNGG